MALMTLGVFLGIVVLTVSVSVYQCLVAPSDRATADNRDYAERQR